MAHVGSDDERRLAELGYKQEFDRRWSGFSNFAISFSIISILSGCFTTFGQAWNNGGPIAISIGWPVIFLTALPGWMAKTVLIISCVGQFFCGMSCITAASRMLFAFSRDRAVPGHRYWTKLDGNRNPTHAAIGAGIAAAVLTLPALYAPKGTVVPIAFFAVTSVTVLGLYLAFMIPIWLRWKAGDTFRAGPWTLGSRYRWMCPLAVAEIVAISIYFMLPLVPAGVPWDPAFDFTAVQYSPIALIVVVGGAMVWWQVSARKWFTGPVRTVEEPAPAAGD